MDSLQGGPSVFFRLGALKPGDLVYVTLADRQVAVFKITGVRLYPKEPVPHQHRLRQHRLRRPPADHLRGQLR